MSIAKRNIDYIVIHCTATAADISIAAIKKYWKEKLLWNQPGYHYIILRDGSIVQLLDEDKISNGVLGNNATSIHIAYIGGSDKEGNPKDNRSESQQFAMFSKIVELTERYPKAQVLGHRDFPNVKKVCPCFDVKEWLANYEPNMDRPY